MSRKVFSNAYDVEDFSSVKCVRCGLVSSVSASSAGFCSSCDPLFGAKVRRSKELLGTHNVILAVPAEFYDER